MVEQLKNITTDKISSNHSKTSISWIMLIYFCSGLCSLMDEVVWVRLIKLTLGNTVYATTIVISMFMGGLALGSFIMARFADRIKRKLKLYAILEICITVSALCLPWILQLMDNLYKWFYAAYLPSPGLLMLVQAIVSAIILLVPAMLMGSTLPLLSRFVTTLEDSAGRMVGRLYSLNTLGATLGCFLAGFVLLKNAGVMGTLYIAAGINLLVAVSGWILSLSNDNISQDVKITPDLPDSTHPTKKSIFSKNYLLLFAVFASGFMSIGYELVWMRSISHQLKAYTYVFSAVLTIYLLGNVIGAWIGSNLSKRLKNPATGFGLSITCLGLSGILFIPWISLLYNYLPSESNFMLEGNWQIPIIRTIITPLLHSFILFLIPSIIMGIGFPLAIQAWNNHKHKTGLTTGTIYGTNTIGAVLGGIITGFLLIPLFGSQMSNVVLGITGIVTGTLIVLLFDKSKTQIRRFAYTVFALLIIGLGILIPSDYMNRSLLNDRKLDTLFFKEGATTIATIKEAPIQGKREIWIGTSNQIIGGEGLHRPPQLMLGHLGVLLNEQAKKVLSIGFGSGETTAGLSTHNLEHIDCVEIAREIVSVALKYLKHINLGDELNEKVNMIYMDGKNYLHLSEKKYDIIINGANLPYESGSAPMFAKEHFENALEHLNANGLFITKLHISTSKPVFDSTLGTFLKVFPHVTMWYPITKPGLFYYLVGSRDKQYFSPRYIDDELKKNAIKHSTSLLFFRDSIDVLSCYIGDENDIGNYLNKFNLNSDYSPFIEFNIDDRENKGKTLIFNNTLEKIRRRSIVSHIDWTGINRIKKTKWLENYWINYKNFSYLLQAYTSKASYFKRLEINGKGLKNLPWHPAILDRQEKILNVIERVLVTKNISANGVLAMMDRKLHNKDYPKPLYGSFWLIKSWAFRMERNLMNALIAGDKALEYSPNSNAVLKNIVQLSLMTRNTKKAIVHLNKAIQLDPNSPDLHYYVGQISLIQGNYEEAITAYKRVLKLNRKHIKAKEMLDKLVQQLGK